MPIVQTTQEAETEDCLINSTEFRTHRDNMEKPDNSDDKL